MSGKEKYIVLSTNTRISDTPLADIQSRMNELAREGYAARGNLDVKVQVLHGRLTAVYTQVMELIGEQFTHSAPAFALQSITFDTDI